MIKTLLFLLIFSMISLFAETIKPKTMHATDHYRHYSRSAGGASHNNPFLSTMEASAEITSMVSFEASSQATTNPNRRGNAHLSTFIEQNRIEITQDIARAEGEYLTTLLSMMHLNRDETYLLALQSNFDAFISLDAQQFQHKLREINS